MIGDFKVKLFLLLLFGAVLWFLIATDRVNQPPGVLAAAAPSQSPLAGRRPWDYRGFRITPLAAFRLRGRVLGIERYWFDAGSAISPVDLAIGWGPISDTAVLQRLRISQGRRWYYFTPRGGKFPLPPAEISSHSANMHIVPANDRVAKALQSLRRGHIIRLAGYLIAAEGPNGWRWKSSLSRTDSGIGACELVWVEQLDIE